MRRLRPLALFLSLFLPGLALAACEDDLVATGEYAKVVDASRDGAEKEVAVLRYRLMKAERALAEAEAKLAAKTTAPVETPQP